MSIGGHHSAKALSTDWLTPPEIIQALGPFDLDPCAAPEPRPWPTANRHISLPQDGLSVPWTGRIWLNPPYGAQIGKWLTKLADHGRGTALIFARTETEWFYSSVWQRATAILFLCGRLHFYYPDGRRAPMNSGGPSCLVAYGAEDACALLDSGLHGKLVLLKQVP